MASAFSHAIAAAALGKIFSAKKQPMKFWILAIFCAVVPDADAIGFIFGIEYGSLFGHRGFTHSLFFALLLGLTAVHTFFRETKAGSKEYFFLVLFYFVCTISHSILDALTTGGLGVAFFSPFITERYFFPFRPIVVSPISVEQFFGEWGFRVIKSELLWIWLPSFLLAVTVSVFRKLKK